MTIQTVSIPAIGFTATIDHDALPLASQAFRNDYGVKQWVQDGAAAPKGTPVADRVAGAQKRVDRLLSGDVPGVVAFVDPIRALAQSLGLTDAEARTILETGAAKIAKRNAA